MTYNYRAFHGTRAAGVPKMLDEGIKADMRRVFFGVAEKDNVYYPRVKSPSKQHTIYGGDSWEDPNLSFKNNWFRAAGADIELDHRILKDAEWDTVAGHINSPEAQKVLPYIDNLGARVKDEYTLARDVNPSEIKRIHVPSLALLPEVYQDLLYKKARNLNIPVSYNPESARKTRWYEDLIDNEFVNSRSGVFEVGNERINSFKDALNYSKETGLPLVAFYNKPRKDVDNNSLANYENWLSNRVTQFRNFTGRITPEQRNNNFGRMAKIQELDDFPTDYKGTNTELAIDMQRRMARQEPIINRNYYHQNLYNRSAEGIAARQKQEDLMASLRARAMEAMMRQSNSQ